MKKRIKIPLLVGSNGRWNTWGIREGERPDWACMADFIDIDGIYPAEKRYWVEVEIEFPKETIETVEGQIKEEL